MTRLLYATAALFWTVVMFGAARPVPPDDRLIQTAHVRCTVPSQHLGCR